MPMIGPHARVSSTPTSPMPNVLNLGHELTLDDLNVKYEVGEIIGTGAFSEVRKATERKTGVSFAVKIIDKSKCRGKENMIKSEVDILKRVKHRHIIRLFEMYESPLKIFLIMEVVAGGELFDRIVARGFYTEADAAKLVYEILLGVQYLHRLNICHRDLKPENLLFYDNSPSTRIMISDFGLSKIFSDEQVMKTACGTPGYVAPEVLRREVYSKQVDMWSIGVITYILLCGYPPFYEENNYALFQQIMSGHYEFDSPYWDNISFEAKNFVARLLIVDPKLRMCADEALNHPFIAKNCIRELADVQVSNKESILVTDNGIAYRELNVSSLPYSFRHKVNEQNNLAPTINNNLRHYVQRRSSDKLTAKAVVADELQMHEILPRSIPALRVGSNKSWASMSNEPGMIPLRPKTHHREVDDSGHVASITDVRGRNMDPLNIAPTGPVQTQLLNLDQLATSNNSPFLNYLPTPTGHSGTPQIQPSQVQTCTVRFLSYSIFMRTPGVKNINHSDHKNARLNYFIDNILPNYDIVCLQEMYAYASTRVTRLVQLAKERGFQWSFISPSKGLLNGCTDGGLVILSRHEIVRHGRITFKRAAYNCRFAAKGALYVKVKLGPVHHIHLFTTNLQKSNGHDLTLQSAEVIIRQTQLAQLRSFIIQATADRLPTEPILILGDFNLNARSRSGTSTEEYCQMINILSGDWRGLANTHILEEFLPTIQDREPLLIRDLLLDTFGTHPITYADAECDTFGHPITPIETLLTDKADQGACHSSDYVLWVPPVLNNAVDINSSPHDRRYKVSVIPCIAKDQEFTHVSDHYAVAIELCVRH